MQIETDDLVTVSKYSKMKDLTVGWIYKLIERKKVECVVISGVKFIKIK